MEGPIDEDNIAETNVISKGCSTHASLLLKAKSNPGLFLSSSAAATAIVSAAQIIKTANGQTVVLTGPSPGSGVSTLSSVNSTVTRNGNPSAHHPNANKSVPTLTQAISVPGMSLVQIPIQSQLTSNMVQSVIQSNHQSVIQAPNTTSIPLQLANNKLILVNNKLGQGSVIQSTESDHNLQMKAENDAVSQAIYEEESKRRREILARRPSYRKILNDLGANDSNSVDDKSDDEQDLPQQTIFLPGNLKVLPGSTIQIGSQDGSMGIQTIMTNANSSSGSTIVQYATAGHDGQFIVPADLQTYQLRQSAGLPQNVVMTTSSLVPHIDEAGKKRELRLLKNREAAKECRRKKKEYIKCLENRVAVLENQNKALIDELKTLKELYCKKAE